METRLLREKDILPTKEVLENALGGSYQAFDDLMKTLTDIKYSLVPQWNYYRDGKTWLCKVCYKKKTIFWLSVWDKFFKITFYFMEKHSAVIAGLDIDKEIKENFNRIKPAGKLIPLTITIKNTDQIKDAIRIVEYKKNLK